VAKVWAWAPRRSEHRGSRCRYCKFRSKCGKGGACVGDSGGLVYHTHTSAITNAITASSQMAKYDLTATMGQYLDKHLVLPMLDYLLESDVRRASLKPRSYSHHPQNSLTHSLTRSLLLHAHPQCAVHSSSKYATCSSPSSRSCSRHQWSTRRLMSSRRSLQTLRSPLVRRHPTHATAIPSFVRCPVGLLEESSSERAPLSLEMNTEKESACARESEPDERVVCCCR
jgi:hypothetical protein